MSKTIPLGHRLRYPITIVKLLKKSGDAVKKQEPLMQYSFRWMKTVGDHIRGDTWEEEQVTIADWDSPVDGDLAQWHVKEGEVIVKDAPCLLVREACSHEIQYQGLCAICGKDMTEVNWASESRDTERAPINMTHDQTSLTVSELQALRAEQELQRRLLGQRKLSLVVDLDQTIIHACIEPTVGEWQRDPSNPNYESVKEVKSFQLNDDLPRGLTTGFWYYIKMRPGLSDFLNRIADLYELHVYTMGTRSYALNVARIVDPGQKLFGNRVISRDENGSLAAKSLQRLFPVSTNMVVIIDDRADVWPRNRPNLIKVTPYDFFKGIGDINSSFLPKREDLLAAPPVPAIEAAKNGSPQQSQSDRASANDPRAEKVSALEELVSMSGGDDPILTKRQIEEQERTLEKQIVDRPLLHLQEKLDKEDEAAGNSAAPTNGDQRTSPPLHQRHHLLSDDDRELFYLEQHLTNLHKVYYEKYDRNSTRNLSTVPDVGQVLDSLKARVLSGTRIVLSGLVPIGVDVKRSEIGLQVSSFGAELRDRVSRDITHLVVSTSRLRTQKVRQAAKIPSIKIINQDWLTDCLAQWVRLDETPYLVEIHPADRAGGKGSTPVSTETTDVETVSDADDSDDSAAKPKVLRNRTLQLQIYGEPSLGRSPNDEDSEDEEIGEDEEGLLPSELAEGQLSPVDDLSGFNWGEADEELDEFLASGSEDGEAEDGGEDGESTDKDNDTNDDGESFHGASRKRKHVGRDDEGVSETDSVDENSIILAKKQRLAKSRLSSSLSTQYNSSGDGCLPTPRITGDEDDVLLLRSASQNNSRPDVVQLDAEAFDVNDDELEADLMAEFEAEERQMRALDLENEKG